MATSPSDAETAGSPSSAAPIPDDVLALAVTIALARARQRAQPIPPKAEVHDDETLWRWAGEPPLWS